MTKNAQSAAEKPPPVAWQKIVAKYAQPNVRRSLWEIANTFIPFFILWYLMYRSLELSYWVTLALAFPTAGMAMRIFIILHDCGHGSFFRSQRANNLLGAICGVFTFTPYLQWRHTHAIHHASHGDLDRRGVGDVKVMTVKEYLAAPWWHKLGYQIYRHWATMFFIAPFFVFVVKHRFIEPNMGRRERNSVHYTNLALLAVIGGLSWLIGFQEFVLVHLPVLLISCTAGVWLFYIQHQFEDTYWEEHPEWDYAMASLYGSSYYRLPKVFQWFSGNIGLHHIHHLSPRIPNYNLQACFDENPLFHHVTIITFWESLSAIKLKLWDDESQKLVGFAHLKTLAAKA
jgi:omega-6 fatty acid desaturase (delta-12 desaturase)